MKLLRSLGMALLLSTAWAAAPTAASLVANAEAQAATDHKNVLVIFHASWCHWCHKLDDLLESKEFKDSFDRSYVIVHVTVLEDEAHKADENPGGMELLTKLGGDKGGIPFFAIFDPKDKKLGDSNAPTNIGFPSEPKEVKHFMKLIRATGKFSEAEAAELQTTLSKKS